MLGGLAIQHELNRHDKMKFLKGLCRIYHGENYTLENLDEASRAAAFRESIKRQHSLYEYMKVICDEDADYIYCDETTFKGDSIDKMITLHFMPDFAIDNLRANNYICHFSVFSRKLLDKTGLFRS